MLNIFLLTNFLETQSFQRYRPSDGHPLVPSCQDKRDSTVLYFVTYSGQREYEFAYNMIS